jgi:hypothetical protein
MKTVAQLTDAIANVNPEDIGRAHKVFEGSKSFYKVANSQEKVDDNGDIIEYSVRHDKATGFTCTCKSGQNGFSNCRLGVCSHVLISLACEREVREAIAEMEAAIAVQAAMSDPATIKAAEVAREAPVKAPRKRRETAPIERKAFSILR